MTLIPALIVTVAAIVSTTSLSIIVGRLFVDVTSDAAGARRGVPPAYYAHRRLFTASAEAVTLALCAVSLALPPRTVLVFLTTIVYLLVRDLLR